MADPSGSIGAAFCVAEANGLSGFEETLEGTLPVFLQTLWDVCLLDISATLKNVSGKAERGLSRREGEGRRGEAEFEGHSI